MLDLISQIVALIILVSGVAWGYRRWIKPRAHLPLATQGFLGLIVLTLMGGFIGSPFWWFDIPQSFSWDLPPLAARMLAAAGWSFAVVCFLALERPTVRRLRLVLLLLCVYLGPLVVVILFFHLNRFDWAAPITYGFFAIAGGMTVATLWYLVRQPVVVPDDARDTAPAIFGVRLWVGALALVLAVWGMALFVTDAGPLKLIWVWPGDLLSSRLIGVMLLAIATGAVFSMRYADTARLFSSVALTYGVFVALANLWSVFVGKPIQFSYLIVFGLIGLGSAFLLTRPR